MKEDGKGNRMDLNRPDYGIRTAIDMVPNKFKKVKTSRFVVSTPDMGMKTMIRMTNENLAKRKEHAAQVREEKQKQKARMKIFAGIALAAAVLCLILWLCFR